MSLANQPKRPATHRATGRLSQHITRLLRRRYRRCWRDSAVRGASIAWRFAAAQRGDGHAFGLACFHGIDKQFDQFRPGCRLPVCRTCWRGGLRWCAATGPGGCRFLCWTKPSVTSCSTSSSRLDRRARRISASGCERFFVGLDAMAQRLAHGLHQQFAVDRLGEKVAGAGLEGAGALRHVAVAGDEDDGQGATPAPSSSACSSRPVVPGMRMSSTRQAI